jgi:hypothetical protein
MGLNEHISENSAVIDVQRRWRRRGLGTGAAIGLGILGAFATMYAIDAATRRNYRDLDAYCYHRYGGYYDPRRDVCIVD